MRIFPGLVSISFRQLSPVEVISLAVKSQLCGIEWGGDIHLPHGDAALAREVGGRMQEAGVSVAAYGSYYRAGESEAAGLPFGRVLDSAIALGAPTIRVWAGNRGSAEADAAYFDKVIRDLTHISQQALSAGITVSLEYHSKTLTDSTDSTLRLLENLPAEGVRTYWQPPVDHDCETCEAGLRAVLPRLSNVHVFHWSGTERLPLAEGNDRWTRYIDILRHKDEPRWALLEFVPGNDPAVLPREAETLRHLLAVQ